MVQTELGVVLESARRALAEKRPDDAIGALRSVPAASAEVSSLLGAAYSSKQDYDNALTCFQGAVQLQPTPRNFFNLAMLHKMRNSPDDARIALTAALNLDPTYEKAKQMLEQLPAPAPQPAVASPAGPTLLGEPTAEPTIIMTPTPAPPAPDSIFPTIEMGDPLRQSRYSSASMPPPPDHRPPSYAPSDSSITLRCTRLIGSTGDWWPYIGWMAFLCWFLIPMATGSVASLVVFTLLLGVWFAIDVCDQCVRWYVVVGLLILACIGTFGGGGLVRWFLQVASWVVYWTRVRE